MPNHAFQKFGSFVYSEKKQLSLGVFSLADTRYIWRIREFWKIASPEYPYVTLPTVNWLGTELYCNVGIFCKDMLIFYADRKFSMNELLTALCKANIAYSTVK